MINERKYSNMSNWQEYAIGAIVAMISFYFLRKIPGNMIFVTFFTVFSLLTLALIFRIMKKKSRIQLDGEESLKSYQLYLKFDSKTSAIIFAHGMVYWALNTIATF